MILLPGNRYCLSNKNANFYYLPMNQLDGDMDEAELRRLARKSGMTPREYCLNKIEEWKAMLVTVSDDYRGLTDDEFEELLEQELDSLQDERND